MMKKIPSLFQRNYDGDRLVRDEVVPGCEWVLAGEGKATEKIDGTCCLIENGKLFKRHELKRGKLAPDGFVPAQEPDTVTGDVPGWIPVGDGPEDRWHREAWEYYINVVGHAPQDGTRELVGPKVQGNPYNRPIHELWEHGDKSVNVPRDFGGIREYLQTHEIEGVVWHHSDGRMCKIKRRDFGFKWPDKKAGD